MKVTIKYKAKLSWEEAGVGHKDEFCSVEHEVEQQEDGTWKTTGLSWKPSRPKDTVR